MTGILRGPRRVALFLIGLVMSAATAVALAQSYRGLYDWAHRHGVPGGWAAAWPLQVDTFLVVGELALFVALVDRWPARARVPAWLVTLGGLAVSVAGNVGHVASHSALVRATAAVPPLAAALALAVGLGVLKRVVASHHKATPGPAAKATGRARARATRKAPGSGVDAATRAAIDAIGQGQPLPSARQLARDHHIGRDKASQVRAAVLAEANGHRGQPGQLTST